MASRRFLKARRFKFINIVAELEAKGSLEIKPTTQLILHPKTNLVASPEGTFEVKVPMDMNSKAIQNAVGGNVINRRKVTVRYSDFTVASTDYKVKILLASMGDTITDIIAQIATPFKYDNGPATVLGSIVRVSVGDMADLTGFNTATFGMCGSSETGIKFADQTGLLGKGTYLWNASGVRVHKVYTIATSLEAKFTASSFFTASLTSGAIHFYIDAIQNP